MTPPHHPTPFAANLDDVHALFDQLIAFMGDEYTQSNVYAAKDAGGTNCGITCTDKAGNSFTYNERIVAVVVAPAAPHQP